MTHNISLRHLLLLTAAQLCATMASAQGVMVAHGNATTCLKDVATMSIAHRSVNVDGTELAADEIYPFPTGTLVPGDATTLDFGPTAEERTICFVSPNVWVAGTLPEGFSISSTYGAAGYQEVRISTQDNPTATVYEGTLTIMGGSGVICTISLRQVGAETPDHPVLDAPRIGDFYYSDGTWSSTLDTQRTPIGIVFRVGCATDDGDNISYYRQKDGKTRMDDIRGYVVALHDAADEGCWWSSFNDDKGCGCSTSTSDFRGYSNTRSIMATADAHGGLSSANSSFPACYYATVAYEEACPAPAETSGWYLPSAYQLSYIWNRVWFDEDNSGRACLENSFKALGESATPLYRNDAEYWTSTEQINSYGNSNYAYYFDFSANNFYNGTISHYRKNTNMLVRSILTF